MLQRHAESRLTEGSRRLSFYGRDRYSLEKALGTCSRRREQRRDRIVLFRPDQGWGVAAASVALSCSSGRTV